MLCWIGFVASLHNQPNTKSSRLCSRLTALWRCINFILLIQPWPYSFPTRPDWTVIYCNGLLYLFPTRNLVKFLINFTFSTAMYFIKALYSLFKLPLNPNQSIIRSPWLNSASNRLCMLCCFMWYSWKVSRFAVPTVMTCRSGVVYQLY